MARALLVAAEDVPDAGVVERVVGREVRAAGDAEYGVDTFSLETFHDGVNRSHGHNLLPRIDCSLAGEAKRV